MSQRVLVTAAASGIVRAFVASGAKVFVCDIDAKGLELLAQELPGHIPIPKQMDFADQLQYRAESEGPGDSRDWIFELKWTVTELLRFSTLRANLTSGHVTAFR